MTEHFVNPRTGETEPVEYIVNPGGAVHSASPDHPAVVVLRGGGDIGDRRTYGGYRFATPAEVRAARRREGVA
jgi:hypothetical protein